MKKSSKGNFEIKGCMTSKGSDKAGIIQAYAVLITSILVGIATIITAVTAF